jgi:hypothetical protein
VARLARLSSSPPIILPHLPILTAALHVGIQASRIACDNKVRVAVSWLRRIPGSRQAVWDVIRAWPDVGDQISKDTSRHAGRITLAVGTIQLAEVVTTEQVA